ncbi:hypothetical protein ADEAN_000114400 [Angomonas deanei]|uniref:Uncharacterized protein n=1 Tax=Angomonas deanei TaxID=59799 RepID=A0A7G2C3H7_9TRYP|nr:hypothetical protein ADEAN_000114400 [Angomonas deanei]
MKRTSNHRPIMPAAVLVNEQQRQHSATLYYDSEPSAPPRSGINYSQFFPEARVARVNQMLNTNLNENDRDDNNNNNSSGTSAPVQGQVLHHQPSPSEVYGEAMYVTSPMTGGQKIVQATVVDQPGHKKQKKLQESDSEIVIFSEEEEEEKNEKDKKKKKKK